MSTKSIRKQGRSFLTILLMLALFLTPLGPGLCSQAARATGTVKNRILNVRSSASTSSSIVCKLTQGTKVTILSDTTGDDGLKWYNVYFAYNGDAKEGYVRADLVNVSGAVLGSSSGGNTSSNTPAGSGSTRYVKPPVAIIRTYASTNADIRSRLEKGSSVTVLSSKTGSDDGRTWYKISFTKNGSAMDGYIRGDLLVDTNPGGTGSTSTDVSGTRYINTDSARIRTYASPNADIRSGLPRGTQVTLISSKTGDDGAVWYKISYTENGSRLTGYVRSDLLSSDKPGSDSSGGSSGGAANTPATVKPAVANIRTYASTSGDIRSKLPAGTSVTILSETTGSDGRKWYQISYTHNGAALKGYIRSDLVTLGGTTGGSSSLGNSSGSNSNNNSSAVAEVRTYASPYADIRATLANGSKVTILKEVTGEDGQKWTKISFTQDNKKIEGYIPSSIIK